MKKDLAIQKADEMTKKYNKTYHVIHEPETYNEIFYDNGYKVINDEELEERIKYCELSVDLVIYSSNPSQTHEELF